ncbi:MAG TPA: YegP family protein [Saprospiraceae bacterium]|nr:YegP family protein [Saprospiraceae bacterium]
MNNPKYTKFKDRAGEYRFNLKAENGEIVLNSEGYTSSLGCDTGIQSVRVNSPFDARYERKTSTSSKFYFVLKASNGQVIGTSEMYETTSGRENGIEAVKRVGPTSPVEDLT